MAFVSDEVIDRWFDPAENSWVYRGFAWLFKNPLWNIEIPRGFSLCPYFWLSVFSWLLFRPFVYAIAMPIIGLSKALLFIFGKPIVKLDQFINDKFFDGDLKPALSLGALILTGLMLFIVGWGIVMAGIAWLSISDIILRIIVAIVAVHVNGLIVAIAYTNSHKYDDNRCKPIYYLVPTLLFSIVLMSVFFPAQMAAYLVASSHALWFGLKCIGILAWAIISWLGTGIAMIFSTIGHSIAVACKFAYSLLFVPLVGLALGLWIVFLGVFGMISMLACEKFEKISVVKKKEDRSVSESNWKMFAYNMVNSDVEFIQDRRYHVRDALINCPNPVFFDMFDSDKKKFVSRIMSRIVSNVIWGGMVNVPASLIGISIFDFDRIKKGYGTSYDIGDEFSDVYNYIREIRQAICHANLSTAIGTLLQEDEQIRTWAEKCKKNFISYQKREEKCQKWTEGTQKFCQAIAYPFVKMGKFIWTVLKEIGRTAVYLWVVAKALKKGACPYRTFGTQPKAPKTDK